MTKASTPHVECLAAFANLYSGAPREALELGEGFNFYPPAPGLGRYLGDLLHALTQRGQLSRYSDPFHGGTQAAFAELLNARLGTEINPEDIAFVQGGTEAISLTIGYLAATGHNLVLPLPAYYAFDQSAGRWGAPIAAYYRYDGRIHHVGGPPRERSALVEVVPNGVTGTHFTRPAVPADFDLVDVVFQQGALDDAPQLEAEIRARLTRLDLGRAAVLMTASKDLCLPGLRAAAIISRDQKLHTHLARDAFDRAPTSAPLASLLMTVYAAILHITSGPGTAVEQRYDQARRITETHRLPPLPPLEQVHAILRHLDAMAARFRANRALLQRSAILELTPALRATAGYSAFPRLTAAAVRPDYLAWIRDTATSGLRLSPTVIHGGTVDAWSSLYPGQHLRINLSEPIDQTRTSLKRLTTCIE